VRFNPYYLLSTLLIISVLESPLLLAQENSAEDAMKKRAQLLLDAIHQKENSETSEALRQRVQHWQKNTLNASTTKMPLSNLKKSLPSSNASITPSESLFIFISFSMPEQTIKRYLQQAERTQANIILNGFVDNDMQKTLNLLEEWSKAYPINNILIDPVLYQRFEISKVPTIILMQGEYPCPSKNDCLVKAVDKLTGDVNLDYALQLFSQEGDLKQSASHLLNTLRSRHNASS